MTATPDRAGPSASGGGGGRAAETRRIGLNEARAVRIIGIGRLRPVVASDHAPCPCEYADESRRSADLGSGRFP